MSPVVHVFAGSGLDRAGLKRRDRAWVEQARANSRAHLLCLREQQPFCAERADGGLEAVWLAPHALSQLEHAPEVVFLGIDREGDPCFAAALTGAPEDGLLAGLGAFEDMRGAAMRLSAPEAAMFGEAKALLDWHERHRFCARCGAASEPLEGGWKRVCPACRAEHFPRTDPVVIMLPVCGDRCVLGRQPRFPPGMWSALAGFVEPGESLEEAIARETLEEVGLVATGARYHSSQPWPFPSSLMLGFLAEVEAGELTVDREELDAARWFTRAEMLAAIEGRNREAFVPPPIAIAHWLIKAWAQEAA